MPEVIVRLSEGIKSGSALLARDITPISNAEGSRSIDIETVHISSLGIDIVSDKACTVQVIRLPDGESIGEASAAVAVPAATPTYLSYTGVRCRSMRVKVTNTSGANMTSMALYVRGGA